MSWKGCLSNASSPHILLLFNSSFVPACPYNSSYLSYHWWKLTTHWSLFCCKYRAFCSIWHCQTPNTTWNTFSSPEDNLGVVTFAAILYWLGFSRKTEPICVCVYRERESSVGATKCRICRASWQLESQELMSQLESEGRLESEFPLPQETSICFLL